jgi:hypothetical protein
MTWLLLLYFVCVKCLMYKYNRNTCISSWLLNVIETSLYHSMGAIPIFSISVISRMTPLICMASGGNYWNYFQWAVSQGLQYSREHFEFAWDPIWIPCPSMSEYLWYRVRSNVQSVFDVLPHYLVLNACLALGFPQPIVSPIIKTVSNTTHI